MAYTKNNLVISTRDGKVYLKRVKSIELPPEILAIVFSHVSDKSTLKSIARCCRRFYEIVAPLLFNSIYVRYSSTAIDKYPRTPTGSNEIRELGLRLLRYQSFASSVHNVRMRGPTVDDYNQYDSVDPQTDTELQHAARRYLRREENVDSKLANTGINWLSFDLNDQTTTLVVLLAVLPNISSLHIEIPDQRFLADDMLSLNIFRGLQKITLDWILPLSGTMNSRTTHVQKLLGGFESLDQICLIHFVPLVRVVRPGYSVSSDLNHVTKRSCPITKFEARRSRIPTGGYQVLLLVFRSLKTVIYEHSWSPRLGTRTTIPIILLESASALHKNSLETLWLDFSHESEHRFGSFGNDERAHHNRESPLRSLKSCNRLRRLCIPMEFMFTRTRFDDTWQDALFDLPRSLETLVLICQLNQWDPPVSRFADRFLELLREDRMGGQEETDQPRILPNLKTLVLIASVDQFFNFSALQLQEMDGIRDLELLLAHDISDHQDENISDDAVTGRIIEVEREMGLTWLGSCRWKGISKPRLIRTCSQYDVLRDRFGQTNELGALITPTTLRRLFSEA